MVQGRKKRQNRRFRKSIYYIVTGIWCSVFGLNGCTNPTVFFMDSTPAIYAENPQENNMAELLQKAAAGAMVKLQAGEVTGSGVLWELADRQLVIATAGHVLSGGSDEIQVTFWDGLTVPIIGYTMTDTDLAFVHVDCREIPEENLAEYYLVRRDRASAQSLKSGDGIILMGNNEEVAGNAYEGSVLEPWIYAEDFAQYMIWVEAQAEPGMSGGGLFDYRGNFLGLLCGTSGDGETVALPLSIMEAMYEGN